MDSSATQGRSGRVDQPPFGGRSPRKTPLDAGHQRHQGIQLSGKLPDVAGGTLRSSGIKETIKDSWCSDLAATSSMSYFPQKATLLWNCAVGRAGKASDLGRFR